MALRASADICTITSDVSLKGRRALFNRITITQGRSTQRPKVFFGPGPMSVFSFLALLLFGAANFGGVPAQQVKSTTASNQPNAKALANESASSTSGRDFASLTKRKNTSPPQPGVQITFEEFVSKTPDPAYSSQGARLVLHNNTQWPIHLGKHYDPTVAGESIIYTIELADGTIDERKYVDVTRDDILMPRKTMSFLVPREDFPKGSKIYVEFAFPWDYVPPQENIGDQTVHRAYFRAADLPPWPQSGNSFRDFRKRS
jgi:hypothetical protein